MKTTPIAAWIDWNSSSKPAGTGDYITTVYVTSSISVCDHGLTTVPYTITTTVLATATTSPVSLLMGPNGIPSGCTSIVTVCTAYASQSTITLTIPLPTGASVEADRAGSLSSPAEWAPSASASPIASTDFNDKTPMAAGREESSTYVPTASSWSSAKATSSSVNPDVYLGAGAKDGFPVTVSRLAAFVALSLLDLLSR